MGIPAATPDGTKAARFVLKEVLPVEIVRPQRSEGPHALGGYTPDNFSGAVHMQRWRQAKDAASVDLVAVFFDRAARTRPHIHQSDQVLFVVDGEGIVATERERRIIRPGDIVIVPAGEWHWHGATTTRAMCHVSARPAGPTDWTVPPRDWHTYMEGAR